MYTFFTNLRRKLFLVLTGDSQSRARLTCLSIVQIQIDTEKLCESGPTAVGVVKMSAYWDR